MPLLLRVQASLSRLQAQHELLRNEIEENRSRSLPESPELPLDQSLQQPLKDTFENPTIQNEDDTTDPDAPQRFVFQSLQDLIHTSNEQFDPDPERALFNFMPTASQHQPESSAERAQCVRRSRRRRRRSSTRLPVTCTSCIEPFRSNDVARGQCSHPYCRECLAELFKTSMTEEALFPPRCCRQTIPMESVEPFLPSKLIDEYQARKEEFETPNENRTYCRKPTCSAFVPADYIVYDVAYCFQCSKATCTICKERPHRGDCPEDHEKQKFLQMAADNGWQRCYSCSTVVELAHGCNHISTLTVIINLLLLY